MRFSTFPKGGEDQGVLPPFHGFVSLNAEEVPHLKLEPKQKREKAFDAIRGVLIRGFVKFCVKDKYVHRVRNPQTGVDIIMSKRRVVVFKSNSVLRAQDNKNH